MGDCIRPGCTGTLYTEDVDNSDMETGCSESYALTLCTDCDLQMTDKEREEMER